jgi:hypothetical protein
MSKELAKMNLIAIVQKLPKEDIEYIQDYVGFIEDENKELKSKLELYENGVYYSSKVDELQEELGQYKNIIKKIKKYIKENKKEYGSLEDNEKIILGIIREANNNE